MSLDISIPHKVMYTKKQNIQVAMISKFRSPTILLLQNPGFKTISTTTFNKPKGSKISGGTNVNFRSNCRAPVATLQG